MSNNDEAIKFLRLKVAKWKGAVAEAEQCAGDCAKTDDRLCELIDRFGIRQGHARSDLELNQEAIIRSRITESGGALPTKKNRKERQQELMELRHELAKITTDLEADGLSFDEEDDRTLRDSPSSS
eukprot:CAMPEP_0194513592 /NCGR_PEP_ID=MMETSP0253-20130528/45904_1 /TAXON_ID=2966 /ORGANISM="Noctiluca scintillans" /LENGTH=125 /DNA_ID=CAMNT_0039357157 /DNA_START=123 /DNA_END=497 /DNA_ORIENTATION=+